MSAKSHIDPALWEEIRAYCKADPQRYGLYLPACNMVASAHTRARMAFGMARKEITAAMAPKAGNAVRPSRARVLFDASCGGFHASLWLPTARRLMQLGVPVGFAYPRGGAPIELSDFDGANRGSSYELLPLPEIVSKTASGAEANQLSEATPWTGAHALSFRLLARYNRKLIATWAAILHDSPVEAVVTTTPFGPWSAAMVCAAREQGIHAIYVAQGLPSDLMASPYVDSAIVWSRLCAQLLERGGLPSEHIHVAANPTLPPMGDRQDLRLFGRRRRGHDVADFVILIIGQKSADQVFKVTGYREAIGAIGAGLRIFGKERQMQVALRPHYSEGSHETEGILRAEGVDWLTVWQGAPLHEDLACADLVVGMHSTAMEEAYLAGKPVVQVCTGEAEPEVDFRVLGCPLAKSAKALADLIENRHWIEARQEPELGPGAGDIIAGILGRRRETR